KWALPRRVRRSGTPVSFQRCWRLAQPGHDTRTLKETSAARRQCGACSSRSLPIRDTDKGLYRSSARHVSRVWKQYPYGDPETPRNTLRRVTTSWWLATRFFAWTIRENGFFFARSMVPKG